MKCKKSDQKFLQKQKNRKVKQDIELVTAQKSLFLLHKSSINVQDFVNECCTKIGICISPRQKEEKVLDTYCVKITILSKNLSSFSLNLQELKHLMNSVEVTLQNPVKGFFRVIHFFLIRRIFPKKICHVTNRFRF